MDEELKASYRDLFSEDPQRQNAAFLHVLQATDQPVDWAYAVWDEMVASLRHRNNRVRAIAAQVLCNLAKSDPDHRMLRDLPALLNVTRDQRFVTARHCLQAIWKVGAAGGKDQQAMVEEGLELRFGESFAEKSGTLVRYDIQVALRHLYDAVGDEEIRRRALRLIETEADPKYRKKYAGAWKGRAAVR